MCHLGCKNRVMVHCKQMSPCGKTFAVLFLLVSTAMATTTLCMPQGYETHTWLPSSAMDTERTGTSTSGTNSQLHAPAVTSHTRMLPSWSPEMSSFWPALRATVVTGPRDSNSRWQRRVRMSQIFTDLSSEPAVQCSKSQLPGGPRWG